MRGGLVTNQDQKDEKGMKLKPEHDKHGWRSAE